jgi:hypothetical protein
VEASSGFGPADQNGGEAAEAQTGVVGAGVQGSDRATAQLQTGPSRPRHRFNGAGAHVASAAAASGARRGTLRQVELTDGSLVSAIFQFQKTSKITFPHKKNRYKVRKNLSKFMEVGDEIWNTFPN